ncbi:MAG: isoprenylcysteine carboxylmethyltransferase family protein [bacterium]
MSTQRGAQVPFQPPLLFFFSILLGLLIHYLVLPWSLPLGKLLCTITGACIGLSGLVVNVITIGYFNRSGQNTLPWEPTPSLILKGPYRFSRNPMYLSVLIMQVGFGVMINVLWIILFSIPAMIVVHFLAVLLEENYLTERFGEEYLRYTRRVRRYI